MERQEAANDLELFTLQAQNFTADNVTTTVQALENVINAETLDQNVKTFAYIRQTFIVLFIALIW